MNEVRAGKRKVNQKRSKEPSEQKMLSNNSPMLTYDFTQEMPLKQEVDQYLINVHSRTQIDWQWQYNAVRSANSCTI